MLEAMISSGIGLASPFIPPAVVPGKPYKGFVSANDLIDGDVLAAMIGFGAGVSSNHDAGWLHYVDGTREFYIARKTLRYGATGAEVAAAGQAKGKIISLNGEDYNVRSMTGMSVNPYSSIVSVPTGGEWDKYMYPIYGEADRPAGDQWSYYTMADLGMNSQGTGNGAASLCCDLHNTLPNVFAARGRDYYGATTYAAITRKTVIYDANPPEGNGGFGKNLYGWRPLVERIPGGWAQFQGEVPAASFITPADLKAQVGIVAGNAINPNTPWLKYTRGGKTLYTPKLPIHSNISHGYLVRLGLVTGNTTIVIGGLTYKVRLMKAMTSNPGDTLDPYGEWTQFIINATNGIHANYTPAQLGTGTNNPSNAELAMVQEMLASRSDWATPGYPTIDYVYWQPASYDSGDTGHVGYGYRPVLELVP